MPARAPWRALSVVLILVWGHPRAGLACPHPCACYVPSEVHCTFRSLASVPAGISKHVERINLGFNSIQALSETSLAGLTKLELLMIHGNEIQSIPDGALRDLISLQVFKFSYNKLRVITAQTLQGLWSLLRLHLDHNKIEFIHPQAFSGLTSLRLLHLEGNVLHQLHPDTFSTFSFLDHFRLSTIRHLYLAENELKTLPPSLLQNMPLLENLYLQGNPWSCDCEMKWFLEWDAKSKVTVCESTCVQPHWTCYDPPRKPSCKSTCFNITGPATSAKKTLLLLNLLPASLDLVITLQENTSSSHLLLVNLFPASMGLVVICQENPSANQPVSTSMDLLNICQENSSADQPIANIIGLAVILQEYPSANQPVSTSLDLVMIYQEYPSASQPGCNITGPAQHLPRKLFC